MKKNIRHFVLAMILAGSSLSINSAHAGETDPTASIQFIGYKNSQPIYKLDIKNPGSKRLSVMIKDVDGNILHQEVVDGENISRNFRFVKEEVGNSDLFVEVSRHEDPVIARIRVDRKQHK